MQSRLDQALDQIREQQHTLSFHESKIEELKLKEQEALAKLSGDSQAIQQQHEHQMAELRA
jgi:hypothetical protein